MAAGGLTAFVFVTGMVGGLLLIAAVLLLLSYFYGGIRKVGK